MKFAQVSLRHTSVCVVNQVFGHSAENDDSRSIFDATVLTLGIDGLATIDGILR